MRTWILRFVLLIYGHAWLFEPIAEIVVLREVGPFLKSYHIYTAFIHDIIMCTHSHTHPASSQRLSLVAVWHIRRRSWRVATVHNHSLRVELFVSTTASSVAHDNVFLPQMVQASRRWTIFFVLVTNFSVLVCVCVCVHTHQCCVCDVCTNWMTLFIMKYTPIWHLTFRVEQRHSIGTWLACNHTLTLYQPMTANAVMTFVNSR